MAALVLSFPALAANRSVHIADNAYHPPTQVVTAGDTVTWTHGGDNPHSVTTHGGQSEGFDSSPDCSATQSAFCMQNGETFKHTFSKTGTYSYFCKIHGSSTDRNCGTMCAKVEVRPAGMAATPRPTTYTPAPTPAPRVTPAPSPTPTPTSSPTPTMTEATATPMRLATLGPVATEETENQGRGALIGLAVGLVAAAAGASILAMRFGPGP